MNTPFSFEHLHQLHWRTLKSVLATLTLLPASYGFHYLWFYSTEMDQMFIRFFAISVLAAWAIITFYIALIHTVYQEETLTTTEQRWITIYRHVPMSFFIIFLVFLQTQWC